MALSCPNTISEDRVNKVSFRINRTEHTFFLLCLYLYCDPRHSRGAAIIITIMAKQMQHKALHPFPVISVPHAHGGDSGNHKDPAWKHPPQAKHVAPLIPYIEITIRSTVGLKGEDPRCTSVLLHWLQVQVRNTGAGAQQHLQEPHAEAQPKGTLTGQHFIFCGEKGAQRVLGYTCTSKYFSG